MDLLAGLEAIDDERRLSAQAEMWLGEAMAHSPRVRSAPVNDRALAAYLESARAAYGYLFLTQRAASSRTFELRQAEAIEFYNHAVGRVMTTYFEQLPADGTRRSRERAGWTWLDPDSDVTFGPSRRMPASLIPTDGLRFDGLRTSYRRDGLGATFAAISAAGSEPHTLDAAWRQPDHVPLTGLLSFPGQSLEEIMRNRQVRIIGRDPFRSDSHLLDGHCVALAADFTAPYGLWLARSAFGRQSRAALIGRSTSMSKPEVLVMQPFDPNRITIVMIHGLASSPEAWINVANALMGYDAALRARYQVWQVYYPTNMPIAVNHADIRTALTETLDHFDPDRRSQATRDMVLVGHSMGGVIARLLVSSSTPSLWRALPVPDGYPIEETQALRDEVKDFVEFAPMPEFTRAVFLAAPHRGSPTAQKRAVRWMARLIRLPTRLIEQHERLAGLLRNNPARDGLRHLPTSVDELSDKNGFLAAAATLPISPDVRYHSIVGVKDDGPGSLSTSTDGVVPYWSSHLDGAQSERAVPAGHNVQNAPAAMHELARILRAHVTALDHLDAAKTPETATKSCPLQ